jgi:hypothetical protein
MISVWGAFGFQGIDVLLCDRHGPLVDRALGVSNRFQGLSHALPIEQI